MKHWVYLMLVVAGLILSACDNASLPVPEGKLEVQDFGTTGFDSGNGVAALPTGVGAVVVGFTDGSLNGMNKGLNDAFIRNYDGGVVWAEQFGTRNDDIATDVALHSSGVSYVLGRTSGALGFKLGNSDVFLRKYSSTGSVVWTRQFGTTGIDFSRDVVVVGNFIYTLSQDNNTGFTIRKWNASGSLLQTIQNIFATINDAPALAVDSLENLYVLTQYYTGSKYVASLLSYNSAGTLLSQKTIFNPTGSATPYDLIIDASDNLYLSVFDNAAGKGGYLRKLSTAGTTLWTRRLEPTSTNAVVPYALALDSTNNVYVSGSIFDETFPGFTNAGIADLFTLKYSPTGLRLWTFQIGGNGIDEARGVAVSDAVYVTGYSTSDPNLLGDPGYGGYDAFLMQLDKATGALMGIDQ